VDDIAAERERLRDDARLVLGVGGEAGPKPPPLRQVLRESGTSVYPLSVLGVLAVVDTLYGYAFGVLTPEISDALGLGAGAISLLLVCKTLAGVVAPLPFAALVQRKPRRALLIVVTAAGWALATVYTGFATGVAFLALVLAVDGLTTASVGVLHQPFLMDQYPPAARVRALSLHKAIEASGNVLAPLLVALLAGVLGFTWRGVFVICGVICVLVVPYSLGLRDPGFGRWDTEALRKKVRDEHPESDVGDLNEEDVELGFFEIARRLLLIPTIKSLLVGYAVFGMLLIPLGTFLSFYLADELGLGPGERGLFAATQAVGSMVSLALYGGRGEKLFRRDPGLVVRNGGLLLGVGVALVSLAVVTPWTPLVLVLFVSSSMVIAALGPALGIAIYSVVPARMRPHAAALQGIFLGGVGGVAGALLLGGVQSRYGYPGALVSLMVPGVLGGLLLARAGKHVQGDLDRMIDSVMEEEQLRQITASGGHLPMLTCKGVDFAYGQLQVLFDVNFTVDDGEMVALLGTNGAGKSTLLKVISGIGLPQKGTVRFRGQEITYLDAERRARLGITQIPGGRAVFGPVSVTDNLRAYGYTLGKSRRELDSLVDECFDAFPRLAERRNSLAFQLSGGEQQMLGLSKALIMKPRLLIIDELSLGLAPVIVGQLLEMVRRINASGTAVVLVEQSVNIALNLVEHAYFMEKGEMRFDGAAADLLDRDDLLRAVFLEGAGAAT
jgi:ABC-type branched-subunit amino acid transport system ATPase component/sugar phosphate permease